MNLIGLDVGERRIGVAFGNTEVRLATPALVVVRTSLSQDIQAVGRAAAKYGAERIVIGLPRNMDGSLGAQAEATTGFGDMVAAQLRMPIEYWDERLTTVEATERRHQAGAKGKKGRGNLDAVSASLILQDYLDAHALEDKSNGA